MKARGYQQGELKKGCDSSGFRGERWLHGRTPDYQIEGTVVAVSKIWQFLSPHICLCLLEETLTAGGLDVLNTSSIH